MLVFKRSITASRSTQNYQFRLRTFGEINVFRICELLIQPWIPGFEDHYNTQGGMRFRITKWFPLVNYTRENEGKPSSS